VLLALPSHVSCIDGVPPTARLTWFGVVAVGTIVNVWREPKPLTTKFVSLPVSVPL
jgi:hypothetical protein